MAKYSENGTEVISDSGTITFARIDTFPTIIRGVAARRKTLDAANTFQGVEMTGTTNIRAISRT